MKQRDNVTKGEIGESTTGIITKDGMFIGSKNNPMAENKYCKLDGNAFFNQANRGDFSSNNETEIFYAEQNVNFQEKPCNTFNELVQVGLQDFSFNDISHDATVTMCIHTNSYGFDDDFDTIKVSSNRCEKNHYEICQSMAKFKSTGEKKYYGIGEKDNESCHCYISTSDNISSSKYLTGEDIVGVIPTNLTNYTEVKMIAIMQDGSLMTFKNKLLKDTHDGRFNIVDENKDDIDDLGPINPTCNPYVGSGPSNLEVTWDPYFECNQILHNK